MLTRAFHEAIDVLGEPAKAKVICDLKKYGVNFNDPNFDLQRLSIALIEMLGAGAASLISERFYLALDELASKSKRRPIQTSLGRPEGLSSNVSGAEAAFLTVLWSLTLLFALLVSIGAVTFTLGLTIEDHPPDLMAYAALSWVPLALLVFTLVTWRPWKRIASEVKGSQKRKMVPVIAKILKTLA